MQAPTASQRDRNKCHQKQQCGPKANTGRVFIRQLQKVQDAKIMKIFSKDLQHWLRKKLGDVLIVPLRKREKRRHEIVEQQEKAVNCDSNQRTLDCKVGHVETFDTKAGPIA